MTTFFYNVLNAGSREILNLDGPLTKEQANQLAHEIERDNDVECELSMIEEGEHFSHDHIHTTPDGRHFRHGDGVEVDGEGNVIS